MKLPQKFRIHVKLGGESLEDLIQAVALLKEKVDGLQEKEHITSCAALRIEGDVSKSDCNLRITRKTETSEVL